MRLGPVIAAPILFAEYIVIGLTLSGSKNGTTLVKVSNYAMWSSIPTTIYAAVESYKRDSWKPLGYIAIPIGVSVLASLLDAKTRPPEPTSSKRTKSNQ